MGINATAAGRDDFAGTHGDILTGHHGDGPGGSLNKPVAGVVGIKTIAGIVGIVGIEENGAGPGRNLIQVKVTNPRVQSDAPIIGIKYASHISGGVGITKEDVTASRQYQLPTRLSGAVGQTPAGAIG